MPLPALALAAGVSGLGSLVSNLIGNKGAKNRQDRANQQNIEFWNMQNAYNHPTEQMKRLREAGLNPNLIYGSSPANASGSSSQIAPSKAAPYNFDNPLSDINKYYDIKRTEAQTNNVQANTLVQEQEAILRTFRTATEAARGSKTGTEAELAKELKDVSLSAAKENLRQNEARTIQIQLDNEIKEQSKKDLIKDVFYRVQNAKETLTGQKLLNRLRQLEADLKQIGIEKNDPWYFRIFGRALGKEGVDEILNIKH
jgi:hypothetical protein